MLWVWELVKNVERIKSLKFLVQRKSETCIEKKIMKRYSRNEKMGL